MCILFYCFHFSVKIMSHLFTQDCCFKTDPTVSCEMQICFIYTSTVMCCYELSLRVKIMSRLFTQDCCFKTNLCLCCEMQIRFSYTSIVMCFINF